MTTYHYLPRQEWPEELRVRWTNLQKGTTGAYRYKKGCREPVRWAEPTWDLTTECVEAFFGWLVYDGRPIPADMSVLNSDRPLMRAYIEFLDQKVNPVTAAHRLSGLKRALSVLEPSADDEMLRIVVNNARRIARRSTKSRTLVLPSELIELGFKLMENATSHTQAAVTRKAALFRDGLMIALLAMRPLRNTNICGIRIGEELLPLGDDYALLIEDTKNGEPLVCKLPKALSESMSMYVNLHRPILANTETPSDSLWLIKGGTPMKKRNFRDQVKARTLQAFGVAIRPHDFRHCIATAIAESDPENYDAASVMLGHADLASTTTYNMARRSVAFQRIDEILGKMC